MTVGELEIYLKTVKDKSKSVYYYDNTEHPFGDGHSIVNAFEVLRDAKSEGIYEGVYLKGN